VGQGTSCAGWALLLAWAVWMTTGAMMAWGRMACGTGVATAGMAGIPAISASGIAGASWFSGPCGSNNFWGFARN
jgi:hypothetical protein